MECEAAQGELLRRFLETYGPSTREHFKKWWGPGLREAGRALISRTDGRVRIAVSPFIPLSGREAAAVELEAERIAGLLGAQAEVMWEGAR